MTMGRLPPRPGEVIDRSRPIDFGWNGRSSTGFAGYTIAPALAASGVSERMLRAIRSGERRASGRVVRAIVEVLAPLSPISW